MKPIPRRLIPSPFSPFLPAAASHGWEKASSRTVSAPFLCNGKKGGMKLAGLVQFVWAQFSLVWGSVNGLPQTPN